MYIHELDHNLIISEPTKSSFEKFFFFFSFSSFFFILTIYVHVCVYYVYGRVKEIYILLFWCLLIIIIVLVYCGNCEIVMYQFFF